MKDPNDWLDGEAVSLSRRIVRASWLAAFAVFGAPAAFLIWFFWGV